MLGFLQKSGLNPRYKLNECIEAIIMTIPPEKPVSGDIACSYSDSVLRLDIQYPGPTLNMTPRKPDINDIENSANMPQLEVFLMAHYADQVEIKSDKGYSTVSLFFKE